MRKKKLKAFFSPIQPRTPRKHQSRKMHLLQEEARLQLLVKLAKLRKRKVKWTNLKSQTTTNRPAKKSLKKNQALRKSKSRSHQGEPPAPMPEKSLLFRQRSQLQRNSNSKQRQPALVNPLPASLRRIMAGAVAVRERSLMKTVLWLVKKKTKSQVMKTRRTQRSQKRKKSSGTPRQRRAKQVGLQQPLPFKTRKRKRVSSRGKSTAMCARMVVT